MKRFQLIEERSTQVGLTPEQAAADRVDYITCVQVVLRAPLQGVPWLEDAEKSIRVLHLLDGKQVNDVLDLEDADHEFLCRKVRNAAWSVIDERLLRFVHTVLNATDDVLDDLDPTAHQRGNGQVLEPAPV
jgi:hypothetical protein